MKIFIGFDPKETINFHVCVNSILTHSKSPVEIVPLAINHLRDVFYRENSGTTEFSLTRFLVPYLCGYEGWALFMDCDMVLKTDIHGVFDEISKDSTKAVYVCKHDYIPKTETKATGTQEAYPRKNWSSFMLFNTAKCKSLSVDYVNGASPSDLHRFAWMPDDMIGELPLLWNWLAGEYNPQTQPYVIHYTLGSPAFEDYKGCDYAADWTREYNSSLFPRIDQGEEMKAAAKESFGAAWTGRHWCPPYCS